VETVSRHEDLLDALAAIDPATLSYQEWVACGGMTLLHPVARAVACRAYASRYRLRLDDGCIWVSRDGLERFARFSASVGVDAARLFGRDDAE
jgi:hypothetical protein